MTPKKAKELIPSVAEQLNFSEKEVTDVIDTFYSELKTGLTTLKFSHIDVEGLGKFYIKDRTTRQILVKLKRMEVYYSGKPQTTRTKLILLELRDRIDKLEKVLECMDKQFERKEIMEEFKQWYVENKYRKNTEDYKREEKDFRSRLAISFTFEKSHDGFKSSQEDL